MKLSEHDRKETEEELLRRAAELVQNANSVILRMDIKGNVTFFNEFARNLRLFLPAV